jgi:hypothetical protein
MLRETKMAYEIQIARDTPIALDEWKAAVGSTDGVQLNSSDVSMTNPISGEVITVRGVDGDADLMVDDGWRPCFRWRATGSVTFKAGPDFDDACSPVRVAARKLARQLSANVEGEEGETYE